jgi:hypothetical protein
MSELVPSRSFLPHSVTLFGSREGREVLNGKPRSLHHDNRSVHSTILIFIFYGGESLIEAGSGREVKQKKNGVMHQVTAGAPCFAAFRKTFAPFA